MIDRQRFHKIRAVRHLGIVKPVAADLHGARTHPRAVQHVTQPNPGPAGISHPAVAPLSARKPRLKIAARVARALIDGRELHGGEAQEFGQRQRLRRANMAANRQPEALGIDLRGDPPVPPHVEAIVGREDAWLIEYLERSFEQGWTAALQHHRPFLWELRRQRALAHAARERQVDRLCPSPAERERPGSSRGENVATRYQGRDNASQVATSRARSC